MLIQNLQWILKFLLKFMKCIINLLKIYYGNIFNCIFYVLQIKQIKKKKNISFFLQDFKLISFVLVHFKTNQLISSLQILFNEIRNIV